MPDSLLRILNVCLLVLLLLFFVRVLRAVWVQIRTPPPAQLPPGGPGGQSWPARGAAPAPTVVRPGTGGGLRPAAGETVLRVLQPVGERGRTFELAEEMTLGRAPGCGVSIPDAAVSQLHARVFRQQGGFWIEDLGSTNGTWVNDDRVSGPHALRRGDQVRVGGTILEVGR